MNRFLKIGIASAMLAGVATPAFGQATNTAETTGSTTIIRPVTISKTADLSFGRIVRPSSSTSTVALTDASDTVTASGNGLVLAGIATSRAKYNINGEGGQAVSITIPANFTMTHTNSTDTLLVTLDPDLTATETLDSSLGNAGTKALNIGGSFPLTTTTVTGAYTGTFNVSVAYQ
jgi:hypothetical protein